MLVLDLGWPGLALELIWVLLGLELHFAGLGFGRRLGKDWTGLHFGGQLGIRPSTSCSNFLKKLLKKLLQGCCKIQKLLSIF